MGDVARQARRIRIGVLSDTHGYLDPAIVELFAGVTHIIHAGDIMDTGTLAALEAAAPVTAVLGNLDETKVVGELPREVTADLDGVCFAVGHKRKRLLKRLSQEELAEGKVDLIVWGHEHVPSAAWIDGTLQLNPGTASSPHEEDDVPTVAIVEKTSTGLSVQFFPLERRGELDEQA